MRDAWQAKGRRRVELAHKALRTDPDCVDAYLLLAEEEASTDEAKLRGYHQALEVAERLLGDQGREPPGSEFWASLEAHPYLEARFALANHLADSGHHGEALDIYEALLALDPVDVNDVRYSFIASLLATGQFARAEAVLVDYDDEADSHWLYSRALSVFGQEGDSPDARMLLGEAIRELPLIAESLLAAPATRQPFDARGYGLEYTAAWHTFMYATAWQATPGALEWLRAHAAESHAEDIDIGTYRLFLDDEASRHWPYCPACRGRTRHRYIDLVARFAGAERVTAPRPTWFCDACVVAMLNLPSLWFALVAEAEIHGHDDIFGKPYRILGTLDESDAQHVRFSILPPEWPDERVRPFAGVVALDRGAWIPREAPVLEPLHKGMLRDDLNMLG
jgi:tetratricopeptide (TPR) repeat protein